MTLEKTSEKISEKKKYDLVLFDLDDTLLDFQKSEQATFFQVMSSITTLPLDDVLTTYRAVGAKLWKKLELGKVTIDQLRILRFTDTFKKCGLDGNAEKTADNYLSSLAGNTFLLDGALQTIKDISQLAKIGIVTNGFTIIQRERVQQAGITLFIEFILTSEELGHAKPDPQIFTRALELASHTEKSTVIMVGDNLSSDILGANRFGIDSCWLNSLSKARDLEATPTFEISSIEELKSLLF